MREGVAKEYGFALYRRYSEKQAAHLLGIDLTTLKRWRRAGKTPYVNLGPRKKQYLGTHIADMMIKGADWHEA
ncbi:DNA-binding protein [Mesorhizobium sp. M2D.F.Ca.ET.223.01.1.1]|nr:MULTISPECIES: helix-turn-helix domain-containing protein [unclassified Mesorhizobium]TGP89374.1 DNA-binding protein [bacterium M00.F.Ca.ET.221.01.1.1]TGP95016.1 DNA-binding protein [bacterium M00.F.Ca.ET.222.01.1.1]TGR89673.1 DNA-binding protein [Mesorhizobium sp. M2D.F.Ca.ET.223.01.1.1]RVD58839.1 DNA-binding protein [Mesorhizobium sp. M2D.F.Ca.ET.140.01.1.1]TGP27930.1 DNA-binding protein [Mesorhizobium sp. M2D.F.Ca.ET.232.01.1.1]